MPYKKNVIVEERQQHLHLLSQDTKKKFGHRLLRLGTSMPLQSLLSQTDQSPGGYSLDGTIESPM
jgi:hypothetical protein